MVRATLILSLLAALWSASGTASASPQDEARALFDQGRTALSTGRFAEARDLFRQSLERVGKPGSAFNLAVALRGTGETVEAVEVLDRLLAGQFGALQKAQRSEAETLRSQAQSEIGTLSISGTPPDLRLRLNGRAVEARADGLYPVDAGSHLVEASAEGYSSAEQRAEVTRGGRATLRFELTPLEVPQTGTLIVEAEPEDQVRIVGHAQGQGQLEQALDPGRYRLEAEGPAGLRAIEAEVIAGETMRVRLQAEPTSILESPWLWVGVGAALVVAGVVIAAVAVGGSPEPIQDPTYGLIQTLRTP